MAIAIPSRTKAAAKCGPSLDYSPQQIRELVRHPSGHGVTQAIANSPAWEPFAWKGTEYSAWMRTVFIAELHGLLTYRPDGSTEPVPIAQILSSLNEYLAQFGKKTVSEHTIHNHLRQAAMNVHAALGIRVVPDAKAMTVRLMDGNESAEAIEKAYDQLAKKAAFISDVLETAERLNYDMRGTLSRTPEFVRLAGQVTKALAPAAA